MDETKQANVGEGPYRIEHTEGVGWRVIGPDGPASGILIAAKTAARKAREMNAAWADDPLPEPMELAPMGGELIPLEPMAEEEIEADEEGWNDLPPGATDAGSAARHAWIESAAEWCKERLHAVGLDIPNEVRVSIGLPFRARKSTIGQCWHSAASSDGHREVFVSPVLGDSVVIVSTLLHELVHAALPDGEGHGPTFKRWAYAAGLTGKPTSTVAGPELEADIKAWVAQRGEYQAGTIDPRTAGGPKQGTRMIKCECAVCGYTARTTAKWLNTMGPPICPGEDHGPMEPSLPSGGGE